MFSWLQVMSELVKSGACYMLVKAVKDWHGKIVRMRSPSNFSTADVDTQRGQCTAAYIAS